MTETHTERDTHTYLLVAVVNEWAVHGLFGAAAQLVAHGAPVDKSPLSMLFTQFIGTAAAEDVGTG